MRVCVYIRPCMKLLITSDVIWIPHDWINKFYSSYMAAVVDIISGCSLSVDVRHTNHLNKSKLVLYKPLIHNYSCLKYVTRQHTSVIKVGVGIVCISMCLKEELTHDVQINGLG